MKSLVIPLVSFFAAFTAFSPIALAKTPAELAASAESGDAAAQLELGKATLKGEGVPADPAKAFSWISKAAAQGNAEAEYSMGVLYLTGKGVEKDARLAAEWFRKAAERGHAKAQFNYGFMLFKGDGAEKDESAGFGWIKKSAEQGFPDAMLKTGLAYFMGEMGQKVNYDKAFPLLLKCAENNDIAAQNAVGLMYRFGHGVSMNMGTAREWLRKAAERGDKKAQANLGQAFISEIGDRECRVHGLKWLFIAEEAKEGTAIIPLKELLPAMSNEEIAEARALVQAFKAKKP